MIVKENVSLKEYSNMKVGGTAKKVVFVESKEELQEVIRNEENVFLIGNGTNVLFDDGFHDICLVSLKKMDKIQIIEKNDEYCLVNVQAGLDFSKVIEFMKNNNLSNIENMSGIPGSMGGIVNMNAGAYGVEIFNVIEEVEILNDKNEIIVLKKENLEHNYRTTQIKKNKWTVISATIKLNYGFDEEISNDRLNKRKNNHPLDLPNLGSTFKNPTGNFAAQIISDLGLKNYRVGNACVSSKHPNFITNLGDATFNDIISVIEHVKKVVYEKTNIQLETEIIIKYRNN